MQNILGKSICGEGGRMNSIDFTNCKRIIGKAYNGANGKKIAIEYDGVIFNFHRQ